jgi:hypothetical protein
MADENVRTEEFRVQGEQIAEKVKELVRQGNIRRVSLKDAEGKTLMDIPLTLGVIGALILPQLAALGAIVVLAAHYRIAVEKAPEEI